MTKWEYHIFPWSDHTTWGTVGGDVGIKEMLNGLGEDGWELAVVVPQQQGRLFVFRRPRPGTSASEARRSAP